MKDVGFSLYGAAQSLFFATPYFLANMAPVLCKGLPIGGSPIDGGRLWRGKPVLGSHKTWRGLVSAVLAGLLAVYLQRWLVDTFHWSDLALFDYDMPRLYLLGAAMGLGAIVGDAVKSLVKRRLNIPEGNAWPPFDQWDFLIGGLLITLLFVSIPTRAILWLLVLTPFGHLLINRIAYTLGLKNVPY